MKNGYEIFWTSNALKELESTIEYLCTNFSERELKVLAEKIENIAQLISENRIEILSFFSNRQNPNKKKLT